MKERPTSSEKVLAGASSHRKLFFGEIARQHEETIRASLPPHTLMQRAGLEVARLALAIAPHAQTVWIACGPGNNGGDGFEAARHLRAWGKTVVVTHKNLEAQVPVDARASWQSAIQEGVQFADSAPTLFDLCIDALFGTAVNRPITEPYCAWIQKMNQSVAPTLSVDCPSGLNGDTGQASAPCVIAAVTLAILTLKPGLFTADGRAVCGDIWHTKLGVTEPTRACSELNEPPKTLLRPHNTHKGSYGDVLVVGGDRGMVGAALLASRAALRGGAGRVYVALLDPEPLRFDPFYPEVMFRLPSEIDPDSMVVVAGCGGGGLIKTHLPTLIRRSAFLVLDADALNAIAIDTELQGMVASRKPGTTVLTPHPLEAARLLGLKGAADLPSRITAARALAERFACTVVLKGSGTIIADPNSLTTVNNSGNARLATAGTGDVLAGFIGARIAGGSPANSAARAAVFLHGHIADTWPDGATMTALQLADAIPTTPY